jgi:hypothetical protein
LLTLGRVDLPAVSSTDHSGDEDVPHLNASGRRRARFYCGSHVLAGLR